MRALSRFPETPETLVVEKLSSHLGKGGWEESFVALGAVEDAVAQAARDMLMEDLSDDPGRVLEDRNIEPIRGELRSSQIVDPEDGKIPWNEVYREKAAALRRAVLTAYDNP